MSSSPFRFLNLKTVLFAGLLDLPSAALRCYGAELEVANTFDANFGSLREQIAAADPGDTIVFAPELSGLTILLTTGQLVIDKDLTIDASSLPGGIGISGDADNSGDHNDADSRVFEITAGITVELNSLMVVRGKAPDGTPTGEDGGGILNHGMLTLKNSTVSNNRAGNGDDFGSNDGGGDGGGIYNSGTLMVLNSTITGNRSGSGSGSSSSGGGGGGIYNTGTLTVWNSTISSNTTGFGGTFGGSGGGILNDGGMLSVRSSTITLNSVSNSSGGGIYMSDAAGINHIENAIVANNFGGFAGNGKDLRLISGTLTRGGRNLIGVNNGGADGVFPAGQPNVNGDFVGTFGNAVDPMLGDLADNGGPSQTHRPLSGSPVINAGDASILPADDGDLDGDGNAAEPLPVDQRGTARVLGPQVDIGAVEDELTLIAALRQQIGIRNQQIRKLKRKIRKAKRKNQKPKTRRLIRKRNRVARLRNVLVIQLRAI